MVNPYRANRQFERFLSENRNYPEVKKGVSMKKYFGLTLLFWSLFIINNACMDSIIWHQRMFWYQDLALWHLIKYPCIFFAVVTGWHARQLYLAILMRYTKERTIAFLTTAFFIGYAILWRRGLFEYLINKFAGRI